mmetsp:Transcript_14555/g.19418  ORF Transcript_14555/g.19418 Transcript_14555/m.19418 type:complete len:210 (-) Transcript_14555:460-1089(-)
MRVQCKNRSLLFLVICISSYQHRSQIGIMGSDAALAHEDRSKASEVYSYHPSEFASSYQTLRDELAESLGADGCTVEEGNKKGSVGRKKLIAAAVQMRSSSNTPGNKNDAQSFFERATSAVERAVVDHNATLVLLQELFLGPYFCQSQDAALFSLAEITDDNPFLIAMRDLARRLQVVLPISMFERKNNVYYNSVVMIDADGSVLGTYS